LVKEQFGFREDLSTDTATYAFLNSILLSLDHKHLVGGLFYDLQKAFDCVNHYILLKKLEFYGITGTANQLMRFYLYDRFKRVIFKDHTHMKTTSEWVAMEHGVPQGSVLGPLLFLIYINEFVHVIQDIAKPILFADDTSIIILTADVLEFQSKFEFVMNMVINWFQNNLLSMNYEKTQFLQFLIKQHSRFNVQIVIPDSVIPNVNSTNFLGLTIDHTLSWKGHILDLSSKLNKACYAIRAVKSVMSPKALKTVYFPYFHSIMSWSNILGQLMWQ
jgi:hypothetical protein